MKFEHEPWRKLYVSESAEHKLLPVFCRTLRDNLIRHAKKDGTLLGATDDPGGDWGRVLGATGDDLDKINDYIQLLIKDGYLSFRKGRLWITRFQEGQEARSPGATRQKRYRDKRRYVTVASPVTVPVTVSDATVTSQKNRIEMKRNEEIPQTPKAAAAPVAGSPPRNLDEAMALPLTDRAGWCVRRGDVADWVEPKLWPEVVQVANDFGSAVGVREVKLGSYSRDSALRAIVELFAAGYTPENLQSAAVAAKSSPYFKDKRGLTAFTPEVVRRLLADSSAGNETYTYDEKTGTLS
jgi:hypothetical protein